MTIKPPVGFFHNFSMLNHNTNEALSIYTKSEDLILQRVKNINSQKEKSTMIKPLLLAKSMIMNPSFQERLVFITHKMQDKKNFLQLQEIRTILLYVGSKFNVDTGRALQKYRETQILSLAVFYDSWWPFLESAEVCKTSCGEKKHEIILNLHEGMSFIDKNKKRVVIPSSQKIFIPINNYKEARQISSESKPPLPLPTPMINYEPIKTEVSYPEINDCTFEQFMDFETILQDHDSFWI